MELSILLFLIRNMGIKKMRNINLLNLNCNFTFNFLKIINNKKT